MAVPVSSWSSLWQSPSPSFSVSSLRLPPCQFYTHYQRYHLRKITSQSTSNSSKGSDVLLKRGRRSGPIDLVDEYVEEEEVDDEEDDRSLDLFVRFVENVFKKVSRRTRKAVRSVIPVTIPTKLVNFSVNGALILAFLWILKAFLQVVCTLGSVIFISILLIQGVWSAITYFQESRNFHLNQADNNGPAWTLSHPAS